MAASKLDLVIEQGTTWALTVTLRQPNTLPVDLTGYTGKSQVRKTHNDEAVIAEFAVTIPSPKEGQVVMSLTDEQTTALDFITGVYDLILISPDDDVVRIIEGIAKFSPEVTKEA